MNKEEYNFKPKYKPDDILIIASNESGHGIKIGEKGKLIELHDNFIEKEVWRVVSLNENDNVEWNVLAEDMHRVEVGKRRRLI